MTWKRTFSFVITLGLSVSAAAQSPAPINFEDHIKSIVDEYCLGCHRGSRARNGLKLVSAMSIIEGGSSGESVIPGDPEASLLYQVVTRTREPFMPYEDDPLPDEIVATIKAWIEAGALENASSKPKPKPAPSVQLSVEPSEDNKPDGEAAMPANLRLDPYWWSPQTNTITALATSPWAPIIAISSHEQVVLYHAQSLELLGVLDFPEGIVNVLAFSRNGSILIAGGGHSAKSGRVVGWDVATGKRLFEIGDEPDAVLAADITNDHRLLAMGGPDRIVRVYSIETGSLVYEIATHTDWVTALAFSPDGVLLATGDRAGGLFVWEADTGREFHPLPAQKAHVTDLDWRSDSMVLAVGGEDAAIRLFEMENGRQIKTWTSHWSVLGLAYARDGRIVTSGRDRLTRIWDGNGKQLVQYDPMKGIVTEVAITNDGSRVIVGDWAGNVEVLDATTNMRIGELASNPKTQLQVAIRSSEKDVETRNQQLSQALQGVQETQQSLDGNTQRATNAEQVAQQAEEAAANAETNAGERGKQVQAARDATLPLQEKLKQRQAARNETSAELAQAKASFASAEAEMKTALTQAALAEKILVEASEANRVAAQQQFSQAEKLLNGATALAQLASSKVAELEIKVMRREAELQQWQALTEPKLSELNALIAAANEARTQAADLRTLARGHRAKADELASVLSQANARVETAQATLATSRQELQAAQQAVTTNRENWEKQRATIMASGGRVTIE